MLTWIISQATFLSRRVQSQFGLKSRQRLRQQVIQKESGIHLSFVRACFIVCIGLLVFGVNPESARSQSTEVKISIISVSPPRVRIEGKRGDATCVWSFRNAYAGLLGLGDRIVNLTLEDAAGTIVPVRKLASGEYEASREAISWQCEVILDPPAVAADASHVSWIEGERGFLMLGDLLPRPAKEKSLPGTVARVRLDLPAAWNAYSNESQRSEGQFDVMDADNVVFFIGRGLRERRERVVGMDFTVITEGTWAFSDGDATALAASILKEYLSRTGIGAGPRVTLMLSHFPKTVGSERWSAETRGRTVTLLSGQSPSKVAGLAQLSTPLTHELFHLWVPNGLNLAGNYDWFYEGFTLYQALCVSVRLGLLTFQDYLNALGRAYDSYSRSDDVRKLSLIEASLRRWTGPTTLVYQKGMLVAFLYDLSLRHLTHGKHTLDDIYRTLFRNSKIAGSKQDGNQVLLAILNENDKMNGFVQSYIEKADEIDLKTMLVPFGLKFERAGQRSQISVAAKLDSRQRELLRAFGYNAEAKRAARRVS